MSSDRRILESRQYSTRVSHWTQYLCIRHVRPGLAAVEICKYEVLCDFSPYDEDDNPVEIPREMDGKKVIGFEDGFLVGGELGPEDDDSTYEYTLADLNSALEWIGENHFHLNDISRATVKRASRDLFSERSPLKAARQRLARSWSCPQGHALTNVGNAARSLRTCGSVFA